jgi:NO-binding membrane sensor protein with MHYT domain
VLPIDNHTYSLLTPGLSYGTSCLGVFSGLRCTARARAVHGAARARWLLLGGASIGVTGVWVAHLIALLGVTVPGLAIRYSVPVTAASLLATAAIVCAGLLVADSGRGRRRALSVAGLITGLGLACAHYLGMAALRVPGRVSYNPALFAASIILAVVAATTTLRAARGLRRVWSTVVGSLIVGAAVSGMDYTGLAAMRVYPASGPAGMVISGAGGVTAESLLLPLVVGISVATFLVTAAIAWSPTEDEINHDAALLARVRERSAASPNVTTASLLPWRMGRAEGRAAANGAAGGLFTANGVESNGAGSRAASNGATVRGLPPWIISDLRRPAEPRRAPRRGGQAT